MVYRRECVRAPDGGHFTLDWLHSAHGSEVAQAELPSTAPVVVLLSGIAGGSGDSYVKHFVAMAHAAGFRPVCFNGRGAAGGPLTTPQFYSASFTADIRQAVALLADRFPGAPLAAVGWSLGANILVNYMGEEGSACPLAAGVSLCNPFDLVLCDQALERGMGRIYSRAMGAGMRRLFAPHEALFRGGASRGFDAALASRAATVRDFDEAITRRCFGFPTVDAYYRASGSRYKLPAVAVPLLCVQARGGLGQRAPPGDGSAPSSPLLSPPGGGRPDRVDGGGAARGDRVERQGASGHHHHGGAPRVGHHAGRPFRGAVAVRPGARVLERGDGAATKRCTRGGARFCGHDG